MEGKAMKIADQIKNRVLSLPEKAFFLIDIDNRPQTLFIDQMNDDDWNNLYKTSGTSLLLKPQTPQES